MQSAMLGRDRKLNSKLSVVALGFLLLPFGGCIRRYGKRMQRLSYMALLLVAVASSVGLAGCTGSIISRELSSPGEQTYTITVTTTSASLPQSTNVTLIVE